MAEVHVFPEQATALRVGIDITCLLDWEHMQRREKPGDNQMTSRGQRPERVNRSFIHCKDGRDFLRFDGHSPHYFGSDKSHQTAGHMLRMRIIVLICFTVALYISKGIPHMHSLCNLVL